MIFVWIIIIWVAAALLYGVISIRRQARKKRRSSRESSVKQSPRRQSEKGEDES